MSTKNEKVDYLANEDHLSITEFPLVISMLCLGFKFTAIDRDPKTPHKVNFVFKKSSDLEKVIYQYWDGKLQLEPKNFWSISRELKSRIKLCATN